MTEPTIREPEQIRQDCVAKFRPEVRSSWFWALLGYLLGEDWGEPRIAEMVVSDEGVLVRSVGEETYSNLFCARKCLSGQVVCISKAVGLDGDEVGYMLAAIAKIKRV